MRHTAPKRLTENDIPTGLLDEMNSKLGKFEFDLTGEIGTNTVSHCATYSEKGQVLEDGIAGDAKTFEPVHCKGYAGKSYVVRINETNDKQLIKEVIEVTTFQCVTVVDNLEPSK